MKLTTLDADLKIHQKLEDEPNDVGGLSAQALKEKFDQAGLTIQKYLNEVHLPEEEQAAREAVREAKTYTDQKVVELGKGDMAMAVYDTQRRRTDVYAYAEQRANEAKADTSNLGYVFGATSKMILTNTDTDALELENVVDPRGLWNPETGELTAPPGAKALIVHLHMIWARQTFASCYLRVRVDGEDRLSITGPFLNDGKYYAETVLLPVLVEGGEKVKLVLEANKSGTSQAEIRMGEVYAEFLL